MLLCLDVGNTHIYGGLFHESELKIRFRYPSDTPCTSDLLGIFLREVIATHRFAVQSISDVILCSVVPALDYTVMAACKKYLFKIPFQLKPGVKTGLKIAVKNPLEVGADRIANAVGAINEYPHKNTIITDFGTATTVCAVTADRTYLGGAILPGVKLSMDSLSNHAAKLSAVDIIKPETPLGKTTETNLQAGVYYGQLGAVKELIQGIHEQAFGSEPVILISTGGYAHLFDNRDLFRNNMPDLVLNGLRFIWRQNRS